MRLEILTKARCFDISDVDDLCMATKDELCAAYETRIGGGEIKFPIEIDLGPRTTIPAPVTWIESPYVWGMIIDAPPWPASGKYEPFNDPAKGYVLVTNDKTRVGRKTGLSRQRWGLLHLNDGLFSFTAHKHPGDLGEDNQHYDAEDLELLFYLLAALAVISSPASKTEAVEPHRGLVKHIRGGGGKIDPGIVHTRVSIGHRATERSAGGAAAAHPKAYHFCRAHPRQRACGRIERVRAHWRGDPAFGYRLPSYNVRPPALIEGDKP